MKNRKPHKNTNQQQSGQPKSGDDLYAEWFNQQPQSMQDKLPKPLNTNGNIDGNYIFKVSENHNAYAYTQSNDFDEQENKNTRTYDQDELEMVVRRIVMAMQLSESPEVLFQARCILIAFGIGDPPTETELARIKGCSRQFVSKKVKRIQQLLNLTPSQYMRSEEACKAYARAWHKHHKIKDQDDKEA